MSSHGWMTESELEPDRHLLTYYAITSLALGPFFWTILVPLYFRYHTLRYRFDDEGVTMRWGILFRKEVTLTYARIQDIHLVSNFVERWLGLARIQVQTASGDSGAEMTIEGLRGFAEVRDFLYSRMRGGQLNEGAGPPRSPVLPRGVAPPVVLDAATVAELAETLRATAAEVRALRESLDAERAGKGEVPRA